MPPVSIKYVVSFSTQDDRHPVSNIVKSDGFKKWLCHPQEKSGQIDAVFQLEQPCVISYIDIDVRHKLERKKKRKLTKDEKKIFIEKATKYLTSAFRDKKTITQEKRNVDNKDSLLKSTKAESAVRNEPIVHTDIVGQNNGVAETNKPQVKRKLENDCATHPPCKIINNNKTPVSLIQKMKSFDSNASCTVKRDLIGDLKKLEQNGPITSCVTSPGTPYQYKGLRGREQEKTVSCAKKNSSSPNAGISRDNISFVMSSDDSSVDDDIDMMLADNRKRNVGKTRGRGKGRGRGQGPGRGRTPRRRETE